MFDFPASTFVNRNIPKNAFDSYLSNKEKRLLSEKVKKIVWLYKLSPDTINITGRQIEEIQFINIELRKYDEANYLLKIIDKVIPYSIVFLVNCDDLWKVVVNIKHPHPTKENVSVIDYTIESNWAESANSLLQVKLIYSLDDIYQSICKQIIDKSTVEETLPELVERLKKIESLEKQIKRIRISLQKSKEFNKRVGYNLELLKLEAELNQIKKD